MASEDNTQSGSDSERARAAHAQLMATVEDRLAAQRAASIEAGRRKGGVLGAAMAGSMMVLSEIMEGPKKDQGVVTAEAAGDPTDLDTDGLAMRVEDVDVEAPALERRDVLGVTDKKIQR